MEHFMFSGPAPNLDDHDSGQWEVLVIGDRIFQNSLMATVLSRELALPCHCLAKPESCPPREELWRLVLFDSNGSDSFSDVISSCRLFFEPPDPGCLVAIFNAARNLGDIPRKALPAGVKGIFFANEDFDLFLKGITRILKGDHWFSRELLNRWIQETRRPAAAEQKDFAALTPREKEILKMVATGASNDNISQALYISYHTVKTHLHHIYRKINVSDRLQASFWAARNL
ncbi:MAG: response regulator transcription factor [Desulfobacterales bacterium]|nr:response regulator transcription factor [Desulfobacterales bacterium]